MAINIQFYFCYFDLTSYTIISMHEYLFESDFTRQNCIWVNASLASASIPILSLLLSSFSFILLLIADVQNQISYFDSNNFAINVIDY